MDINITYIHLGIFLLSMNKNTTDNDWRNSRFLKKIEYIDIWSI
jgi:hypothetical protein